MNLNYREQLIYQNEKSAKKERDELERQKVDFQAEVDAAAEQKIAAEKKRLQKKSECEIAKLRQEEEVIFEAKIEAEKAALQAEYNAEEVKWDRIKAMVPKIAVLTVFFILVIFMFNQCNGIVRDENRALTRICGKMNSSGLHHFLLTNEKNKSKIVIQSNTKRGRLI